MRTTIQRSKVKTLLLDRCTLRKFHATDSQNTPDQITSDGRSKRSWSDLPSVHFIPFILNGRLSEFWLHICRACVIATWPGLLEAWLVLTSVTYQGNLYILIPLNQRLALTRLRATGPWRLRLRVLLSPAITECFVLCKLLCSV